MTRPYSACKLVPSTLDHKIESQFVGNRHRHSSSGKDADLSKMRPPCTGGFTSSSLYSSLEDILTEPEVNDKKKWPIRIATKHLVKPGMCSESFFPCSYHTA